MPTVAVPWGKFSTSGNAFIEDPHPPRAQRWVSDFSLEGLERLLALRHSRESFDVLLSFRGNDDRILHTAP